MNICICKNVQFSRSIMVYPHPVLGLELLGSGATLFDRPSRLIHSAAKLGSALVVTSFSPLGDVRTKL